MIRRLIHIVILMLSLWALAGEKAMGQEFPWLLQYITNMNTLNPAYVGMWDRSGLMISTRTNWVGINGAPLNQQLSYFTSIKDQRSGIGLNIQRTNIGREKRLFFTGDYSYQIRLDMYNYIRFGMRAGIVNYDNNLLDYQLYPDRIPDTEFISDIQMYFMTVFGVGAVYFNENLFISFSVPQVINNTFKVNRSHYSSIYEFNTAYLAGGYVFKLVNNIQLRANLLAVATIGRPLYFDAAAVLYLPVNLQFGFNIRTNGSTCLSAQYTFRNNLRIGFAADYAIIQDIRKYQFGSYEIVIGYEFNQNKRKSVKPNYF